MAEKPSFASKPPADSAGPVDPQIEPKESQRLSVLKTYKLFIGGKFPRTESGRTDALRRSDGTTIANVCRGSRKDFREAVAMARKAQPEWAKRSAYNRSQILYRIAELLEDRRDQFKVELVSQGEEPSSAHREIDATIDRLVYYAGWADKLQQVFGSVNPVASSHFNFSMLEPTGVVCGLAPEECGLLGLVSLIAPAIVCGNSCVVLASETRPLTAITFGEVLHSSDVPAGVVNLITGRRQELQEHFATHMDVNALVLCDTQGETLKQLEILSTENLKRVVHRSPKDWFDDRCQSPYWILDTQEVKTTWHPIGT